MNLNSAETPHFLILLTSQCASRHNGVHFFDIDRPSNRQKVVRTPRALTLLTWKCASRHNGVHFLDISTSKSGPTLVCFVHFDLEMCFAPQRRALFRHLNFQKWSENRVLCTFWLGNVLRATTACTFSTSQLPKVVRTWCVLYILTSTCASRHNGVQFFISHLASWLRTRRFSEVTFRPSGAAKQWKKHNIYIYIWCGVASPPPPPGDGHGLSSLWGCGLFLPFPPPPCDGGLWLSFPPCSLWWWGVVVGCMYTWWICYLCMCIYKYIHLNMIYIYMISIYICVSIKKMNIYIYMYIYVYV